MKRRPEQLSMLTLMGGVPERREPFHGSIITMMEYDELGNITKLTVEGAEYHEAMATKAAQGMGGIPTVDSTRRPHVVAEEVEGEATDAYDRPW